MKSHTRVVGLQLAVAGVAAVGAAAGIFAACSGGSKSNCNVTCPSGCDISADCTTCNPESDTAGAGTACQTDLDCCTGSCLNSICTPPSTGTSGGSSGGGSSSGGSSGGGGNIAVGGACSSSTDCSSDYCSSYDGGPKTCKCNDGDGTPPWPCHVEADCCSGATCTTTDAGLGCVTVGGSSSGGSSSSGGASTTTHSTTTTGGSSTGGGSTTASASSGGSTGTTGSGSTGGTAATGSSSGGTSGAATTGGSTSGGSTSSGSSSGSGSTSGGSTSGGSSGGGACGVVGTNCTKDSECCSKYCPVGTGVCTCNCANPSAPYACATATDCCTTGEGNNCTSYASGCVSGLCQ